MSLSFASCSETFFFKIASSCSLRSSTSNWVSRSVNITITSKIPNGLLSSLNNETIQDLTVQHFFQCLPSKQRRYRGFACAVSYHRQPSHPLRATVRTGSLYWLRCSSKQCSLLEGHLRCVYLAPP